MTTAKTFALSDPRQYNYDDGRALIKSGDLISFFSSHEESFLHRFTTVPILFFTGSRIYHSGIAIWVNVAGEPRLMLCEAVGVGRRILNMSHFKDHKMEVHECPDYIDPVKVERYMMDGLGLGYAFGDLIVIGLREYFGLQTNESSVKQVCSETAANAWAAGGMKFDTTVMSPGKLRNTLIEKGITTFVINADKGF